MINEGLEMVYEFPEGVAFSSGFLIGTAIDAGTEVYGKIFPRSAHNARETVNTIKAGLGVGAMAGPIMALHRLGNTPESYELLSNLGIYGTLFSAGLASEHFGKKYLFSDKKDNEE